LLQDNLLFTPEEAQGNIAMSCLKYLMSATNLIDPSHDLATKKMEVARGYHGLCLYASKNFTEHFLTYLVLAQTSAQSELRDSLLQAADGLATLLTHLAPLKRPVATGDKVDSRLQHLRGREPTLSMVASELILNARINTRPRRDAPGKTPPRATDDC
jgi:hypothetical protein